MDAPATLLAQPARKARLRRPVDPRQRLVRHITCCWRTQALHVAVQLDLPDQLAAGRGDVDTLAEACACSVDGLRRLLRALCSLQVCRERRDGRFELTPGGLALCREPPDRAPSLRALVLWWGGPMWPMWADLAYSVRTGNSARARQMGQAHYGFLDGQPDMATLFHAAMQAMTALIADDVAALPTWHDATWLVDAGGGNGALSAAVAAVHARLRISVLDRPDAEPGATEVFERHALAARAGFVAGDFFTALPSGASHYLLKSILHNWDDAACLKVLARCADAAPAGSRLLVVERLRPERLGSTQREEAVARTDLNMLAGLGGRERSLREFAQLLGAAGFEIIGVTPTRHEFSVIETRRL